MPSPQRFTSATTSLYIASGCLLSLVQAQVRVLPANFDPQKQICFRYGHQTAVIDKRLYVDGGILQIDRSDPMGPLYTANYTNPDFVYYDLSTTFQGPVDIRQPPQITNKLRKKPNEVPSLTGGTLWADTINKRIFLYGGKFTASPPSPFTLWSYDAIYDTWAAVNQSRDSSGVPIGVARLYNGASAVVDALGMAYYFGGWISSESEYGYEGKDIAVASLLVYDMVNNNWRNQTFAAGMGRRAEGVLVYVPLGDLGLLIAFGGIRVDEDGRRSAVPMSEIAIYNIRDRHWFTQTATGDDIPASRKLFCAGVASGTATGRNGAQWPFQNIYLYGGASTSSGPGFDDVYILSLPSFVWTKFWPLADITSHPHQSLTCNVIQNSQMLILGGFFPLGGDCDDAEHVGLHNLNLSGSNMEKTVWADFQLGLEKYQVPTVVIDNLNLKESSPVITFNHPDIFTLVSRSAPASSRSPTRDVSVPTNGLSSRDRTIVLATAIPGGILILALLFFCIRWYKNQGTTTDSLPSQPLVQDAYNTDVSPPIEHKYIPPRPGSTRGNTQNWQGQVMQLPSSPVVQPPALALRSSQPLGNSTVASSTVPIAPIEHMPVAYVINPAGAFTPVYSSVGTTSPPMTANSRINSRTSQDSQIYGGGGWNRQQYSNTTGNLPMELPADQPKPYGY